ncbi:MAG: hypothetical protein F4098_14905, partial [Acidimicrobiaceae bacterium]|nr:hypothetical protein [Acidimicrobiaceae bacterium]
MFGAVCSRVPLTVLLAGAVCAAGLALAPVPVAAEFDSQSSFAVDDLPAVNDFAAVDAVIAGEQSESPLASGVGVDVADGVVAVQDVDPPELGVDVGAVVESDVSPTAFDEDSSNQPPRPPSAAVFSPEVALAAVDPVPASIELSVDPVEVSESSGSTKVTVTATRKGLSLDTTVTALV